MLCRNSIVAILVLMNNLYQQIDCVKSSASTCLLNGKDILVDVQHVGRFNDFGVDGGPAAKELIPKLVLAKKHISSQLHVNLPDIEVRNLFCICCDEFLYYFVILSLCQYGLLELYFCFLKRRLFHTGQTISRNCHYFERTWCYSVCIWPWIWSLTPGQNFISFRLLFQLHLDFKGSLKLQLRVSSDSTFMSHLIVFSVVVVRLLVGQHTTSL